MTKQAWENRIIGEGAEAPDQLLANPQNYRRHPKTQKDALAGALDEIGWIQRVIVNQRTGQMVDGHARVELAIARGEPAVPVVYVDLSEEEERIAIATIDPIAGLAYHDEEQLGELLSQVSAESEDLQAFLDGLGPEGGDGAGGGEGESPPASERLVVVVEVSTGADQAAIIERLKSEGYDCSAETRAKRS
ncbi:MAG TPA: ParB N-terminal domain-containing protein [Gammaproteobacteria bacterium]|nr:ParB N-terminal domain-containing protein [Gammaproteobacteria bacterium]